MGVVYLCVASTLSFDSTAAQERLKFFALVQNADAQDILPRKYRILAEKLAFAQYAAPR